MVDQNSFSLGECIMNIHLDTRVLTSLLKAHRSALVVPRLIADSLSPCSFQDSLRRSVNYVDAV
jgi:hypothetical protein